MGNSYKCHHLLINNGFGSFSEKIKFRCHRLSLDRLFNSNLDLIPFDQLFRSGVLQSGSAVYIQGVPENMRRTDI